MLGPMRRWREDRLAGLTSGPRLADRRRVRRDHRSAAAARSAPPDSPDPRPRFRRRGRRGRCRRHPRRARGRGLRSDGHSGWRVRQQWLAGDRAKEVGHGQELEGRSSGRRQRWLGGRGARHACDRALADAVQAQRLADIRKAQALNQQTLAKRMKVSQARISKIEHGTHAHPHRSGNTRVLRRSARRQAACRGEFDDESIARH